MVMGSAAVIMTRATVAVVAIGMRVRHAILVRRDFPVLVGMGGLRHAEHGQSAEPKDPEMATAKHEAQSSPRFSKESSRPKPDLSLITPSAALDSRASNP